MQDVVGLKEAQNIPVLPQTLDAIEKVTAQVAVLADEIAKKHLVFGDG